MAVGGNAAARTENQAMTTTIALSDSARVILSKASVHPQGLAVPTPTLKGGAAAKVAAGLIKRKLVLPIDPRRPEDAEWMVDGDPLHLRITDEGMRAIGIDPNEGDANQGEPDCSGLEGSVPDVGQGALLAPATDECDDQGQDDEEAAQDAPQGAEGEGEEGDGEDAPLAAPAPRANRLKDAAVAFLAAWDASPAEDATDNPISRAVADLRASLVASPRSASASPRKPREGKSKRDTIIDMLKRADGATIDEIAEVTGWQTHSIRGFFASLKKAGMNVTTSERAREDGDARRGRLLVYRA